jgi:hypothetical protein
MNEPRVDPQSYHAAVQEALEQITEEFPYVTSRNLPVRRMRGGVTSQVTREIAARLIVDQTHTLATAEEVERYQAQEQEQRQLIAETERRNMQNRVLLAPGLQPQFVPAAPPEPKAGKKS